MRKSQYFPFWMFSAKQGNYWNHFYNVFGMTQSLNGDWTRDLPHSKPGLYHYIDSHLQAPFLEHSFGPYLNSHQGTSVLWISICLWLLSVLCTFLMRHLITFQIYFPGQYEQYTSESFITVCRWQWYCTI